MRTMSGFKGIWLGLPAYWLGLAKVIFLGLVCKGAPNYPNLNSVLRLDSLYMKFELHLTEYWAPNGWLF